MNHLMLFVFFFCLFFSFGSSIHCTMEFNWYVMFFTLAKFHFENIFNDNDELIEFISIHYYKRNILSCCLLIFIIIIIIIIIIIFFFFFFYCYLIANLLQVPRNSNSEFHIIRRSMREQKKVVETIK